MRSCLVLVGAGALIAITVFRLVYFSGLTFVNGTDTLVYALTVSDRQHTWTLGDLKPGGRVNFRGHLEGEGGADIKWEWKAQKFEGSGCYYTGLSPSRGVITITGAKLAYRCG